MIIGITGFKQSGKSTIATYLKENYGFYIINFADPIKQVCKILFDWTEEHVNGKLKEIVDPRWGISPRNALQIFGTEIGQYFFCDTFPEFKKLIGKQLWVKLAEYKIESLKEQFSNFAIGDVRFPHEAYLFEQEDNKLWRVQRSSTYDDKDLHESEIHIPHLPADVQIDNNGNYESLFSQIDYFIAGYKTR